MREIKLDKDWKFSLENPEAAHLTETNDEAWEEVTIPHDWSMNFEYDGEKGEGCTGYILGGLGWYRRHFETTKDMSEGKVFVHFDGIYNRASIYCNGTFLKFHPFGYSPCLVDITKYLNPEGMDNCIAVRVDHTRYADSRWYTGSGIYRTVKMYVLPKVHIPVWGTYFTTPKVTKDEAEVKGKIKLNNTTLDVKDVSVVETITSPDGQVAVTKEKKYRLYPEAEREVEIDCRIQNPVLWEIHEGKSYDVEIKLMDGETLLQEEHIRLGLRSFEFNTTTGFEFNGRKQLIKGVCLHHDAGAVGAAIPLDVWKRRLEKLKECGCNAIRTAHNPTSEDFLDLCDEMGMLVQEEFYDEWDNPKGKQTNGHERDEKVNYISRGHSEYFQEYAKSDLQNTVLRDRNHPCIFMWSIGNEIEWTYPKYNQISGYFTKDATGGYFTTLPPYSIDRIKENFKKIPKEHYEVAETANKLTNWTKELDTTRPVVANCILPTVSYETGYTDALDVVGYSYRRVIYEYGHKNYPDKPILGTENVGQWNEWKPVLEHDYVPGIFLWTGIDYMGESKKPFPEKGGHSGLLNFAGFEMPSYHMFHTLWNDEPYIHCETQTLTESLYKENENGEIVEKEEGSWKKRLWAWQIVNRYWNYNEGEKVVVEAYTNCEEAELFVNGVSAGVQKLADNEDHIIKWLLPYADGDIKVVGRNASADAACDEIATAGKAKGITLVTDKSDIKFDVESVAHVVAELVDEKGTPVRHEDEEIEFCVEGPAKIIGIDNGSKFNVAYAKGNKIKTFYGKTLLMVQATGCGEAVITAKSMTTGAASGKLTITCSK